MRDFATRTKVAKIAGALHQSFVRVHEKRRIAVTLSRDCESPTGTCITVLTPDTRLVNMFSQFKRDLGFDLGRQDVCAHFNDLRAGPSNLIWPAALVLAYGMEKWPRHVDRAACQINLSQPAAAVSVIITALRH
ncbi:hypothetical protein [Lentibacter sp. XHP0401]|uniref:hypothetical protein n=1 Tax=Lentibacter sp. XHP0401 TaxID=2984334 RepID=UPI0021E8CB07|nr:hypothetical protein [Lentibacter sp. XHP0401]MCV2892760.1 hypothetical protein [Lentibacter sp. XHP0401]